MGRVRRLHVLATALFLVLATSGFHADTPAQRRNAIVISWDGVSREHVQAGLDRNQLPHLARLIREGHLLDLTVTGHTTDTKSGHAQMLTGYGPTVTGVYSNKHFRPIPLGLSIFERLTQSKRDITTIMVTGKHMGLGPGLVRSPIHSETDRDDDRRSARRVEKDRIAAENNVAGEPWYLAKDAITVWDGDLPRDAWSVGGKALLYLDRHAAGHFFAFFHFGDVDTNGHKFGEQSKQCDAALIEVDTWLGKIVDKLKTAGTDDRTLIYVTADHGFDPGTTHHKAATRIFLATNDPLATIPGEQQDVTPTVLEAMGVDISKITPPFPGRSLHPRKNEDETRHHPATP